MFEIKKYTIQQYDLSRRKHTRAEKTFFFALFWDISSYSEAWFIKNSVSYKHVIVPFLLKNITQSERNVTSKSPF